ncbi:MAG: hypothetical protein E7411_03230 [Ruminococcaceae bacterium]|nr:hypothetical protein [Oscillospiraceae bacterium]
MFGRRPDGREDKRIDPIVRVTSMFMPQRCDAQVMVSEEFDYEPVSAYIKRKRAEGFKVSLMNVIVAAFVKTVCEHPEFNRFIVNKKIYQRNEICVSYAMLKKQVDDTINETTVKVFFDENDTLFTIAEKMNKMIEDNRDLEAENFTDKLAKFFLAIPLIPGLAIGLVRLLDRYGLLPKFIIDASPFHTSMFITNMASIKMPKVYHHIYNFGTTSVFFSMGQHETKVTVDRDMNIIKKTVIPLGVVIDERICSGAEYARGVKCMFKYMANPELMEK